MKSSTPNSTCTPSPEPVTTQSEAERERLTREALASLLPFLHPTVARVQAGTIESIEPNLVRGELAIEVPLYVPGDDQGVAFGRFGSEFDHAQLLFDDLNITGTKDKLHRSVKLREVFASELELQARTMGLPIKEGGWMVEGTVKDVLVMNREVAVAAVTSQERFAIWPAEWRARTARASALD